MAIIDGFPAAAGDSDTLAAALEAAERLVSSRPPLPLLPGAPQRSDKLFCGICGGQDALAIARRFWKRFVLDVDASRAASVRNIRGYNSYLSVLAGAREHGAALEVRRSFEWCVSVLCRWRILWYLRAGVRAPC